MHKTNSRESNKSSMSESIDELRALLEQQQERIKTLEEQQAQLQERYQETKEQNEQVLNLFEQFKSGSISRRAFLTSVSAVAGISWLAGSADAAPSWSNASGNSGTESKPLKNVYAQNGTFESVSTRDTSITEDGGGLIYNNASGGLRSQSLNLADTETYVLSEMGIQRGTLIINKTADAASAIVDLPGGSPSFVFNGGSQFSTTQGNSGTINIYENAGGDYEIENQQNGDRTVSITYIGRV
jgi:hypothetical protein